MRTSRGAVDWSHLCLSRDQNAGVQFYNILHKDGLDVSRQGGDLRAEHDLQGGLWAGKVPSTGKGGEREGRGWRREGGSRDGGEGRGGSR